MKSIETRIFPLGAALALAGLLTACGSSSSGSPTSAGADSPEGYDVAAEPREAKQEAGTTDAGASDAPPPDTRPIAELSLSAWTWVPFPQALCRDGSSTGIGVNLGASNRVMIFLEGGGACLDPATCATNPSSFGEADFDSRVGSTVDEFSVGTGILDRTNAANPVHDWSFVYVPYCTGDFHAGNNVTTVPGLDLPPQHFVGHKNVELFLDRLVPTFRGATQVLLTGISAGGYGAALDYARVAEAFGATPVTLLDDSGPFMQGPYFAPCFQSKLRSLWGLDGTVLPDSGGGSTTEGAFFLDLVERAAKAYPSAAMGLADSDDDSLMSLAFGWGANACTGTTAMTGATFTEGLLDVRAQLAPESNFGEFIFPGIDHTSIQSAAFYTRLSGSEDAGTEGDAGAGTSMTDWVAGLLRGTATNTGP